MKKTILTLLVGVFSLTTMTTASAQNQLTDKEFGVKFLGSLGLPDAFATKYNTTIQTITGDVGYGFSAGFYYTLAINNTKKWSIQPELLFHSMNLNNIYAAYYAPHPDVPAYYYGLSLPLLFKYHISNKFSLYLGPTIHYSMELIDKSKREETYSTRDRNVLNLSITPGFELAITKRIKLEARYHYMFINSLKDSKGDGTTAKFNLNPHYLEMGLAFSLCNGKAGLPKSESTPIVNVMDSDKDGIADADDKCPNVAGVPANNGCPVIDTDKDGIADADDKCPNVAGVAANNGCPVIDTDKDGIADVDDKCPNVAGVAANNGCPVIDTDNDGIADVDDKCPNVAGVAANNGCPVIDTDKDGIADIDDKCPNVAGVAANNGCPAIIDTDKDGIADADDKCPNVAGVAANNGCPAIEEKVKQTLTEALKGVKFESGKSVLKTSSYAILDNVVGILKTHPEYKLSIAGHTDATGNAVKNLQLSKDRANTVKKYLTAKGIDANRLFAEGYGSERPIDTNDTKDGQENNRRVELNIVQ